LLAGVAVVDARAFFLGGMVLACVRKAVARKISVVGIRAVGMNKEMTVQTAIDHPAEAKTQKAGWVDGSCRGRLK
jgi:hypothetical protein